MVQKVKIKRTATPNLPPINLEPGELAIEMASPHRLWVGVPANLDPSGRKLVNNSVIISDAAPSVPSHGLLWWESKAGILWLYYIDPGGLPGQWVQAAGSAGGGGGGSGGGTTDAYTKAESDAQHAQQALDFVNVTGDSMTGPLSVAASISSTTDIVSGGALWANQYFASSVGVANISATGPNGTIVMRPNGASDPAGQVTLNNGLLDVSGTIRTSAANNTGYVFLGTGNTKYFQFDGTNFNIVGGARLFVQGAIAAQGDISAVGVVTSASAVNAGTYYFGEGGTRYLTYNGASYSLTGGNLATSGDVGSGGTLSAAVYIAAGVAGATGNYYFGNTWSKYLAYDGANYSLVGGALFVSGEIYGVNNLYVSESSPGTNCHVRFRSGYGANRVTMYYEGNTDQFYIARDVGVNYVGITPNGMFTSSWGYGSKMGTGNGPSGNTWNFHYSGTLDGWVDATNLGPVNNAASDYRLKENIAPLPSMWDKVKALRPISYTQKEFSPPTQTAESRAENGPLFAADPTEKWGFIAHELQETLTPSAAFGVKDDPTKIQSPHPLPLIAALTKTLQEAMEKIDELTARVDALSAANRKG